VTLKPNLLAGRLGPVAGMALILAGCATPAVEQPTRRSLPSTGQVVAQPVAPPAVRETEDPRLTALRFAQALGTANSRLRASARRYDAIRGAVGQGRP
jgi:hypothetical protein